MLGFGVEPVQPRKLEVETDQNQIPQTPHVVGSQVLVVDASVVFVKILSAGLLVQVSKEVLELLDQVGLHHDSFVFRLSLYITLCCS